MTFLDALRIGVNGFAIVLGFSACIAAVMLLAWAVGTIIKRGDHDDS